MNKEAYFKKLSENPDSIGFNDTISVIDSHYAFTPTAFKNGSTNNEAGTNNGSCKIFAFALLNDLNKEQTLACFGDYYRKDVLNNPDGEDHQNIRNFIEYGWEGILFQANPLSEK